MEPLLRFIELACAFATGIAVGRYVTRKHAAKPEPTGRDSSADGLDAPESGTEVSPAPSPMPEPPSRPATELGLCLFPSPDPVREMRSWVKGIRRRQTDPDATGPDVLELFLARKLEEAGVLGSGFSMSGLKVVRPHTNGMFYLRIPKRQTSYGETLSMYCVEAALNAGVLAEEIFSARPPKDESEVHAALETLEQRITAQIHDLSTPTTEGDGEWAARLALSHAIECLRLPYRLITRFRMNLAAGLAAIEFEVTPEEVFPKSKLVDGAGVVPTTSDMRLKEQTDYTSRLVALLAECAFASSERISNVFIAAVERTPEAHNCLISAGFDRKQIADFMDDPTDDVESLLALAQATVRLEDGTLKPCVQGFSLDEERFCPPSRYEPVGLSSRELSPEEAQALGTRSLRGLEIDESERREQLAEDVAKLISPDGKTSCEEAVRAVLELSSDTSDESLRKAATKTAQRLVEGTLEPEPLAIIEALNDDEGLVDAVTKAQEHLVDGKPEEAVSLMKRVLAPIDAQGTYRDTPTDEWRAFSNYVDRVLYNLTLAKEDVTTHLVPESYIEAIITCSMACLVTGRGEEALALARRAAAICPVGAVVRLHLAQCLEHLGHTDEARQQLVMLLTQAHDPEGLGFGYYRVAMLLWNEGKITAARAAYQRSLVFMPPEAVEMLQTMGMLVIGPGIIVSDNLSPEEIERELATEGIPFAPTKEITQAFMRAARVSLDAGIFPVARDFMRVLGAITRDDVLFGVFRSLEDEPDR